MNPLPGQVISDTPEPTAARRAVPVWLMVLMLLLLFWGMVYFDQHSAWCSPQVYAPYHSLAELQLYQPPTGGVNLDRGRAVYENVCALCHNTDGTGKPNQAPPFAGSEWALGSPNRMIRIPLSGLSGSVSVKEQEWNLAMPAMGAALSDDDLAAALTYIRQSWGNKASEITPDQVKATRAEVGNRPQPWSAAELNAIP
jgi:mono/diheme cytochrome c family protein